MKVCATATLNRVRIAIVCDSYRNYSKEGNSLRQLLYLQCGEECCATANIFKMKNGTGCENFFIYSL